MSLWKIAWRYLWTRPLVTVLTLLGVMLGSALICGVLTLHRETERSFAEESTLFDMVVGAKGSPLQLTLSSIYHLDIPTGNIPYPRYEALKNDKRVTYAIAIGLGDNFRGYRIVGTFPEFFDLKRKNKETKEEEAVFQLSEGQFFQKSFDAVLGAEIARQTGLKTGDQFYGTHGLVNLAGSEEHQEFPYTVTGILQPTGTANDRAVFTPLDSVWIVHDREAQLHAELKQGSEVQPATKELTEREVTAVLVQLKIPGMRLFLADEIQRNTESMVAIPINEMLRLYKQVLAPVQSALITVAYLVVVVSALSILATLYQSAERRRRDVAILRSLGAHPSEVFFLMLIEAFLLTLLGIAGGWFTGHLCVSAAGVYLQQNMGLTVSAWTLDWLEVKALLWVGAAGLLAGIVPAVFMYRRSPVNDLSRA